ncbi:PREDICTED: protein TPX2-like isoform X2 [Brassica oleracea var. oleracea]|uniref:TPX2 central domain-containing protein n=1 Tax=Brassica oleracea var. oleracea TaxID=109376 RepID=A0A0D3DFI0_BRAOL|nr:PREDICTED: protein TPX2-like isoform X2 [Brassica oleracea var. oleracea]
MEMEPMVFEVDLEYEFDAARWFDFTREESPAESQSAEFWFHSAPSYTPSPFVTKLLLGEEIPGDMTEAASTKPEDEDFTVHGGEKDGGIYHHPYLNKTGNGMRFGAFSSQQAHKLKKVPNQPIYIGPTVSNHNHPDKPNFRAKSSIRPTPRSSTLMRPTASQLAKQNNASKFHMQADQVHDKGLCGTQVQAAKRQKLDGGLLRKVADTKPEMTFVHKIPKKDITLDRNSQYTRTKITVPQEPDFATSQRAHRLRRKNDENLEQDSTTIHRFKARPFNRKIFDAPSLPIRKKSTPKPTEFQEFHLKTSERAMQHSSAVTTRSSQRNDAYKGSDKTNITDALDGINRESRRPSAMDISKHDVSEGKHVFKARTLNKKILSSRGDMGLFKNSKRETTFPLEFSFHSEKRVQPDLPTDLFSKLSIKPEIKQNSGSRTRFPQAKGFKENRVYSFQAGNEVTRVASGKTVSSAGHIQSGHSGIVPETNQQWTASRSLGIR